MNFDVEKISARVLPWFTGKARANAYDALQLLAESARQGGWVPGASRKVLAALTKSNVARNLGRANRHELERVNPSYDLPREVRGYEVSSMLQYNSWNTKVDFAAVHLAAPDHLKPVIVRAWKYAQDFAEVATTMRLLDATRPKPVFTTIGASPTVTALLASLGFNGVAADAVEVCPIEWELVEKDGKRYYVGKLLWPEGTKHNASRYAYGTNHNQQCHACGHAIKNAFNWVPLIIRATGEAPRSLWVGRDCARTLFGIKVTGEVELERIDA